MNKLQLKEPLHRSKFFHWCKMDHWNRALLFLGPIVANKCIFLQSWSGPRPGPKVGLTLYNMPVTKRANWQQLQLSGRAHASCKWAWGSNPSGYFIFIFLAECSYSGPFSLQAFIKRQTWLCWAVIVAQLVEWVASNTRDPWFQPQHWQNFLYQIIYQLYNRKDKYKEKETGNGQTFKKHSCATSSQTNSQKVDCHRHKQP